jgi:hypothetical protein
VISVWHTPFAVGVSIERARGAGFNRFIGPYLWSAEAMSLMLEIYISTFDM